MDGMKSPKMRNQCSRCIVVAGVLVKFMEVMSFQKPLAKDKHSTWFTSTTRLACKITLRMEKHTYVYRDTRTFSQSSAL